MHVMIVISDDMDETEVVKLMKDRQKKDNHNMSKNC